MEVFNKSVNNAVQFILCLQDCCDNHRKSMELIWQQQYTSFLREWKQNQIIQKKQIEKNVECVSKKDLKSISTSPDSFKNLEELALADSLLEKARSIRTKNQKVLNGLIDKNISTSSAELGAFTTKCDTSSINSSDKNKSVRKLPQSKSDYMLQIHKSLAVPRSKSATLSLVPNDSSKSYHKIRSRASPSLKSSKTNDDLAVISNKDLNHLKKLCINVPSRESKSEKSNSCSDSSGNKTENQSLLHPPSKEILNKMKGILDAVPSDFKVKLWYPFLSSKSEVFLRSVKCNSSCSIKRTYSILYSIQETMMWIDLLYLMENEICPGLVFEANNVSMLKIYSYLLSIFHKNSQRIPILDLNQ